MTMVDTRSEHRHEKCIEGVEQEWITLRNVALRGPTGGVSLQPTMNKRRVDVDQHLPLLSPFLFFRGVINFRAGFRFTGL